jgi:hypothetical protein
MGDRVYMRITCRREDAPHFERLGFVEDDTESEIAISMVDEDANYGHWQPLQDLAKAGVPFFGWHDPGGDYDGCFWHRMERITLTRCARHTSAGHWCQLTPTAVIDSAGLIAAQSYYDVLSKARAVLAIREETPP